MQINQFLYFNTLFIHLKTKKKIRNFLQAYKINVKIYFLLNYLKNKLAGDPEYTAYFAKTVSLFSILLFFLILFFSRFCNGFRYLSIMLVIKSKPFYQLILSKVYQKFEFFFFLSFFTTVNVEIFIFFLNNFNSRVQ